MGEEGREVIDLSNSPSSIPSGFCLPPTQPRPSAHPSDTQAEVGGEGGLDTPFLHLRPHDCVALLVRCGFLVCCSTSHHRSTAAVEQQQQGEKSGHAGRLAASASTGGGRLWLAFPGRGALVKCVLGARKEVRMIMKRTAFKVAFNFSFCAKMCCFAPQQSAAMPTSFVCDSVSVCLYGC
jgi:hypothetical protein